MARLVPIGMLIRTLEFGHPGPQNRQSENQTQMSSKSLHCVVLWRPKQAIQVSDHCHSEHEISV